MIFKIKRNALHIDVSVSLRGVEQIEPKCSSDIRGVTELPASLQTVTESASPLTSCGTFVKDILKTNNGREHNQAPVPKTNPPPPAPPHAHTANKYQDRREATLPPSDGCLPKSDRQALLITYSIDQAQVNRGLVGHLRGQTPEAISSPFGTLIANCGTDEKHRACCEIAFVRS